MDEVTLLLDRAVGDLTASVAVPPVSMVRAAARRRSAARVVASVAVVLLVVIGCVVGLAGNGRASEWSPETVASSTGTAASSTAAAILHR